ncbi:1-acyl-sn-glycerol-3-phosphate acyltransferase [Campylobacter sp. MIT 99-7217]|uniref:lysophospholipid acyltransferase family protein n=1 Tax=Campylobacter sp. MIT 99-7217 TaxID=535091 RepID=UPI00115977DF|nr:lysophospholipid acyltransferase family protein [Campylobacter sp. MIT 99-7217]TQR33040.1 1-acyl-sn-glycerol-3-phosphate acyltransferase [Campylobacter sp. MIT 99-7217]
MIYSKIKAVFYAPFFILSVLLVFLAFCFTRSQHEIWQIRQKWAKLQGFIFGFDYELEGEFEQEASMILMNHQSMLDIIALEALYPKNLAWIAKKELKELPIFKYAMIKPKLLCIDRKNPRDLVRILKEAKQRLDEGRVLAIFPEGTRSKSDKMLKFQSGAKILNEKLNLKIQPILIVDSSKILDSKSFSVKSGTLKLICLPLVDANDEHWLENTRKQMQERLEQERSKIK